MRHHTPSIATELDHSLRPGRCQANLLPAVVGLVPKPEARGVSTIGRQGNTTACRSRARPGIGFCCGRPRSTLRKPPSTASRRPRIRGEPRSASDAREHRPARGASHHHHDDLGVTVGDTRWKSRRTLLGAKFALRRQGLAPAFNLNRRHRQVIRGTSAPHRIHKHRDRRSTAICGTGVGGDAEELILANDLSSQGKSAGAPVASRKSSSPSAPPALARTGSLLPVSPTTGIAAWGVGCREQPPVPEFEHTVCFPVAATPGTQQ